MILSDASYAVHAASSTPRGPVQLNLQFRENLAPDPGPVRDSSWATSAWNPACVLQPSIEAWQLSSRPHCCFMETRPAPVALPRQLVAAVRRARRGLVVVGNLWTEEDRRAAVWLSERLGWPLCADVQSGLQGRGGRWAVPAYDQVRCPLLLGGPGL